MTGSNKLARSDHLNRNVCCGHRTHTIVLKVYLEKFTERKQLMEGVSGVSDGQTESFLRFCTICSWQREKELVLGGAV